MICSAGEFLGDRLTVAYRVAAWAVVLACVSRGAAAVAEEPADAIRKASAAYVEAYNTRDDKALAEQWTLRAELIEGGASVRGRDAILASLRGWRERHPQASLQIRVDEVEMLAGPLARVSGTLQFTRRPGEKPVESRFVSLRVLEDGVWRLAESVVVPSQAAALDEFDWLLGSWQATDSGDGATVDMSFEKPLGAACIVGRSKLKPKTGPVVETLSVIHADRQTGLVRSWVFDSTGARAEGVFESDGVTLHQSLTGTPADAAAGRVAQWVQLIAPAGDGRMTTHAVDRSLDGVALPDGEPRHFRKIR